MTMHAAPRADLAHSYDQIDFATARAAPARPEATPPSYGGPQRDAINSVADGIVGDICNRIATLRRTLDVLEQQILTSAAEAKHALNAHVVICQTVNDEVARMRRVVADLGGDSDDA
jgi:hypothetical protein